MWCNDVCLCVHSFLCMCTCVRAHVCACVSVGVRARAYVCQLTRVYVCVRDCVYVCMFEILTDKLFTANVAADLQKRETNLRCKSFRRWNSVGLFVGWLLNVPATCECISGTDLLRQFYMLPH